VTDRRDLLRLSAFLLILLAVAGGIALATQGGSDSESGVPASGQGQVDGLVVTVTPEQLVLRPSDGRANMTFAIRQTDRQNFDVFHLQQHAADGLPTRVTYVAEGGTLYALRADDAPEPNVG
jgi:hypothetical protein